MAISLKAPDGFRRITLIVALLLVGLELGVFWFAARLTMLLAPRTAADAELGAFVVFWSLLTLQAMTVVGFAWTLVALSRTTLEGDAQVLSLAHPWRRWSGVWADVAEAYVSREWLHIRVRGRWRSWHVKHDVSQAGALEALRSHVPRDAWLTREQARGLMMKRLLPPVLIGGAVGAGAILVLNRWIERTLNP
jgi:hypothetical protein